MELSSLIVDIDIHAYPIVLDSNLCQIEDSQRYIFMFLVVVLFFCTLTGNISSLYVNARRKLRPFFRACLISLACSDLIYCIMFTTNNMALFSSKYLEVWTLGSFMCNFVPFVNTASVLSSSLLLVAIAVDRYMAVTRAAIGVWNPSLIFCVICIGGIWLTCIGSAVPLFSIYKARKAYVQTEDELLLVTMCMGLRRQVGIYNIICLSLIFVPCIVAFMLLNLTIARQLWQRRHQQRNLQQQKEQQEAKDEPRFVHLMSRPETAYAMKTAFSVAANFDISTAIVLPPQQDLPEKLSPAAAARVARHRRMVRVVLLMMGTFICLRLPAWIFLLMRIYGSFSTPVAWLFYFSFGLLNLTNCALNPLFYTFLPQTIHILSKIKQKLCCRKNPSQDLVASMPKDNCRQRRRCFCCGLQVTWRCYLKSVTPLNQLQVDPEPASNVASSLHRFSDVKDDIYTIYTAHSLQSTASIASSSSD